MTTPDVLHELARPLRRAQGVSWFLWGGGAALLALGGFAWIVRAGWVHSPGWVLAAWAVTVVLLVGAFLAGRRALRALAPRSLAQDLERGGRWRTGMLTALFDRPGDGTSEALRDAADRSRAAELLADGPTALEPAARQVRTRGTAAAFGALAGLVAFTTAGPVRGTARALWHPGQAWEALVAPVRILPEREVVEQGDSLRVEVRALGRTSATLWTRDPGESWKATPVSLDSTGRVTVTIGPLEVDRFLRATSGGRTSDTVHVRVRLPAFLGSIEVTAHFPAYLGLDAEPLPVTGDTILLPAGTRLATVGQASAGLRSATWLGAGGATGLVVDGTRFTGDFVPRSTGAYVLSLVTQEGASLAGDTVRLAIRVIPDLAPTVEIPVPGVDTLAPLGLTIPLVLDARDDHGLAEIALITRRVSRGGRAEGVAQPVPLPAQGVDRAIVPLVLDLTGRGLEPGDTLRYFARVVDRSPARQVGTSREFVLVIPLAREAREAQREATAEIATRLDSLVAASRALERQAEDLARLQNREAEPGRKSEGTLGFEEAKRSEAIARGEQQLVEEAESLEKSLRELAEAAKEAGIGDSAWNQRLEEIREQLRQAMSPELRAKLAALQDALKSLDPERAREALKELADAQQKLREAMERARELFRRAAAEGVMASLEQEAKEMAGEQRDWVDNLTRTDTAEARRAEAALAARADSLARGLDKAGESLDTEAQKDRMAETADQARQAAAEMRQAAASAGKGDRNQARSQGESAEQKLRQVQEDVQRERQEQQDAWREEVMRALDRALAETARLSERQLTQSTALRRGDPLAAARAEQGSIEEGVQKLLEQITAVSGRNALVSPQIALALAVAQQRMAAARNAISTASPNLREAESQAGEAVDALNVAAYALLRSRSDVEGSSSGSGLGEAMERMAQLAKQQGSLSQQAGGMLPLMGQAGIQEQLRQLGQEQRSIAREMERMRARGELANAGQLAEEARDLARRLESGRLDREMVARQERLFRRMLDAGRTLHGEERDEQKERQSERPKDGTPQLPPALRARLAVPWRPPSWEELQRFSPEERRLVADYFRRLASGGAGGTPP